MGLPDALWGKDLDDLLSYKTARMVKIRDRRLCIGRILISIGVLLYVVIYAIIEEQGYLKVDVPVGAVRLSLRGPSPVPASYPSYCNASTPASAPVGGGISVGPQQLPCVNWTYLEAVYPATEEWSVFLASRVGVTAEQGQGDCLYALGDCTNVTFISDPQSPGKQINQKQLFVPFVEDYTLMLRHSVYGPSNGIEVRERDMKEAYLVDSTGDKIIKDFSVIDSSGFNGPGRTGDVISVSELLSAAGLDLSAASLSEDGQTNRYAGIVILLYLEYHAQHVQINQMAYRCRVVWLHGLEHKVEQVLYSRTQSVTTLTERRVLNRHGIRVVVVVGGVIGRFSFLELMKTLVTGLALFKFARILVDLILIRFLPFAPLYRNYKYLETVDFSEVEKQPKGTAPDGESLFLVKNAETGEKYEFEAHDFVYGTLLRGGHFHRPEWIMGLGPGAAYDAATHGSAIRPAAPEHVPPHTGEVWPMETMLSNSDGLEMKNYPVLVPTDDTLHHQRQSESMAPFRPFPKPVSSTGSPQNEGTEPRSAHYRI
eukprot:TRINITY_DN57264_c0_g1_i1.p1 TRINITY_DN57264_c0_g1~~TRINITY_DN57264_c0_g1_i1.p1  ORF type:complete len:549 (+),score=64.58 TRINITY_DN57264_c0_g1_i1:30-1649(+)